MNILHIACTNGDPCNGVQVVVPQHLVAQGKYANVAFVNITNVKVNEARMQFEYKDNFSIADLPVPFHRPDIVIFHECYRIQYIKIAKELRKMKIPYVILPHGELSKDAQKKKHLKKFVANILLFNRFINHAAGVQMLSETELNNTTFGKYKFVATNGISIPHPPKQQFREDTIKFVYIGRLDAYHKGLDLMIEGASECADILRSNSCTIDIYGPNIIGRREYVEKLISEHNVGDIFTLHDPVFGEEKKKILFEGDVFIQTSRFEGMPMGILEAMSYGLPCLVTDGTTLGGFVKEHDAGWSCGTNAAEITRTIELAIQQKATLAEKSKHAREAVSNSFSWDIVSRTTISIYQTLIVQKR